MKKLATILPAVLFLLITFSVHSQSSFSKRIISSVKENESCAILTIDHSAVVSAARAYETSLPFSQKGLTISKIDTSGNLAWRKTYDPGKPKWSAIPTVIMQQSTGYVVVGTLYHSKGDAMIMKIDNAGNLLSFNRLHPDAEHHPSMIPNDAVMRPDGALVMTGIVGLGHEHPNVLWIKTDETFSSYTVKSIPSVKEVSGIRIFAESNNKTIIAMNNGNLQDNPSDNNTAFPSLMKLDADGNVLNTRNYKLPFAANLNDCIRLVDGSYVMVGTGIDESYIMKVNSAFDLVWFKSYPIANNYSYASEVFKNVTATPDGGFIISGSLDPYASAEPPHQLLMKTDASGNGSSYLIGEGTDAQSIVRVFSVSNAMNIATGLAVGASTVFTIGAALTTACPFTTNEIIASDGEVVTDKNNLLQSGPFVNNYYLESANLNIQNEGSLVDYCSQLRLAGEQPVDEQSLFLFPNPASGELHIVLPASFSSAETTIEIFNLVGQRVLQYHAHGNAATINVGKLSPGNYFVRAIPESGNPVTGPLQVQ